MLKLIKLFLDCGSVEEDGGFGVRGQKTRFATLQRQRSGGPGGPGGGGPGGGPLMGGGEYDPLRSIRNNISSLSQEVTYAELTLPRNRGYTPLRRAGGQVASASTASATNPLHHLHHLQQRHHHHHHQQQQQQHGHGHGHQHHHGSAAVISPSGGGGERGNEPVVYAR